MAQVDDPDLLPQARFVEDIVSPRDGFVAEMDTAQIGWAAVGLGGGRLIKSDKIDHAVGFTLTSKIGDQLAEGQVIGQIHANDLGKLEEAREQILEAIKLSETAVEPLPNFYGVVS